MTPLGLPYRDEDWPHGLRCIDCHALFSEGMSYSNRLESITDGDITAEHPFDRPIPIVHIICVPCALKGEES